MFRFSIHEFPLGSVEGAPAHGAQAGGGHGGTITPASVTALSPADRGLPTRPAGRSSSGSLQNPAGHHARAAATQHRHVQRPGDDTHHSTASAGGSAERSRLEAMTADELLDEIAAEHDRIYGATQTQGASTSNQLAPATASRPDSAAGTSTASIAQDAGDRLSLDALLSNSIRAVRAGQNISLTRYKPVWESDGAGSLSNIPVQEFFGGAASYRNRHAAMKHVAKILRDNDYRVDVHENTQSIVLFATDVVNKKQYRIFLSITQGDKTIPPFIDYQRGTDALAQVTLDEHGMLQKLYLIPLAPE